MTHRLYTLHAHAAIHAGTGQGAGLIDLPIAREAATSHPHLPGSTLKGVLRDRFRDLHDQGKDEERSDTWAVFGPDTKNADKHAGSLQVCDARTLLFPVRSERGTFAWVTCPLTLHRLARDGGPKLFSVSDDLTVEEGQAIITQKSALRHKTEDLNVGGLTLAARDAPLSDSLSDRLAAMLFPVSDPSYEIWRETLKARLCVVHDDSFTWMVNHRTELRARVSIDHERGTAKDGALWTEELLPAETVLAGVMRLELPSAVMDQNKRAEALWPKIEQALDGPLFVGGKVSVGHGLVQARLWGGPNGQS